MTQIQKNIIKSSFVLLLLFLLLIVFFLGNLLSLSDKLINSPYNGRLKELRKTTIVGSIYDTNNVLLAGTKNDERQYHSNLTMRKSLSHIIGDTYGYCPTGAEIRFGSVLLDYNESLFSAINRQLTKKDRSGQDIQLTIDCRLNVFAADQMSDFTGAVVVQDYTTGEVLCMISTPSFDPIAINPNQSNGGTTEDALINRAIQGQYAPGSLFHIVTAGAAIEYIKDINTREFVCNGSTTIDDETILCDHAHGLITLEEAFAQSCNVVFAQLGVELGPKKLTNYAKQLKFNYDFNYSDIALYPSNINVSRNEEDSAFAYAAIGQHENIVSPFHMAMIAGAIANDGVMMTPNLLKAIDTRLVYEKKHGIRIISKDTAQILQSYMGQNVAFGAGNDALSTFLDICGKDGIAISSTDDSLFPNAWFLGYVSNPDHPLVICVIAEQSYDGDNVAIPIAKSILEYAYSIGY